MIAEAFEPCLVNVPKLIAALRAQPFAKWTTVYDGDHAPIAIFRDKTDADAYLCQPLRAQRDEVWDQAIEIAQGVKVQLSAGSASRPFTKQAIIDALIAARDQKRD